MDFVYFCKLIEQTYFKMADYIYLISLSYSPLVWGLLAAAAICGIILLAVMLPRVSRISRKSRHDDEAPIPTDGYPAVSVIVYSQADGWNLRTLLEQILDQDYPAPMEVIVVNDENADSTEEVVSALELKYRNLYMTFAPERSRNLSRKKLSVTLGLKAARYPVVMLTCGNCRIESNIWLRLMMRHFIEGYEVVLGTSRLRPTEPLDDIRAEQSRSRSFNTEWDAVRGFGAALAGHPFMGDAANLAYKKQLFFANKGFSSNLNLQYGDDDIFVNEVTTKANTAVELSPDSQVDVLDPNPAAMSRVMRLRRMFTSAFLPKGPYLVMGLFSLLNWLMILCGVAAAVLALPSVVPAAAILLVLLPAVWLPIAFAWKRSARALGLRQVCLSQPLLMLWHPFANMACRIRSRRQRNENYTWGTTL